jgi:hypothetical protein
MKRSTKTIRGVVIVTVCAILTQCPKTKIYQCGRITNELYESSEILAKNSREFKINILDNKNNSIKEMEKILNEHNQELDLIIDKRLDELDRLKLSDKILQSIKDNHKQFLQDYITTFKKQENIIANFIILSNPSDFEKAEFKKQNNKFKEIIEEITINEDKNFKNLAVYCSA